jgi:hypothetical protein
VRAFHLDHLAERGEGGTRQRPDFDFSHVILLLWIFGSESWGHPASPLGEKVAEGRMRGSLNRRASFWEPLIASHALGTSPQGRSGSRVLSPALLGSSLLFDHSMLLFARYHCHQPQ